MTRNISIAIVSTLMPETHYTRYLVNSLSDNNHGIKWYAYTNRGENIKPLSSNLILRRCWSKNFLYPIQICKVILKDKVRIIHLQHEINMYGGPTTAILFPVLVLLLRLIGGKVVVTIHAVAPKNGIDPKFLKSFSRPANRLVAVVARIILSYIYTAICHFSNVIIVHTDYLKSQLRLYYKDKRNKIKIIPHGVPERNVFFKRENIELPWHKKLNGKKIILYFGYMAKRKGLEYLIGAFEEVNKRYSNYVLVLSGGILNGQESYVEGLKKIVQQRELSDNIVFTSFVQRTELEELLFLSDFVVLPCIYSVAASGPLAQAISFYKPVIATDLGTFHEEIEDGIEGILCPPKDTKSLTNAMIKLINNPELLAKMSANVKEKAKERSWINIAKKTYEIYKTLGYEYRK